MLLKISKFKTNCPFNRRKSHETGKPGDGSWEIPITLDARITIPQSELGRARGVIVYIVYTNSNNTCYKVPPLLNEFNQNGSLTTVHIFRCCCIYSFTDSTFLLKDNHICVEVIQKYTAHVNTKKRKSKRLLLIVL